MPIVYIGVGSNQGDLHKNIQKAAQEIGDAGALVKRLSPFYSNPALCKPRQAPQPDFLNAVFELETDLSPESLLDVLETVERRFGRTRKSDWSPRALDLDILLYDDRVIETEKLKIPHPEMKSRDFVLKPLADLAPDVMHPVLKKNIRTLLQELKI
jgi:2-amino-4-hydroxy-6-hydroxymethyldihydropteridine diphosphokinase